MNDNYIFLKKSGKNSIFFTKIPLNINRLTAVYKC
jgi:hypothetical protein